MVDTGDGGGANFHIPAECVLWAGQDMLAFQHEENLAHDI